MRLSSTGADLDADCGAAAMTSPVAGSVVPAAICNVLSAARHLAWSDRVLADVRREAPEGIAFHRLPWQPGAARQAMKQADGAGPRLLMAFATQDSLASVTRILQALGADRPPTLLV